MGGVHEIIKNNQTGFIIDNFDKEEFYEKLVLLITDSKLNTEMGEKAYKLVNNEFAIESNARKFEGLYRKIN